MFGLRLLWAMTLPTLSPKHSKYRTYCQGIKVFRNKDLAPKRALKRLWGSFEGRLGGRTSKLPQSDFYFRGRRVLSQFISVTDDCDKKLGVRLGRSATSQQFLKMKIDGAPRKRE